MANKKRAQRQARPKAGFLTKVVIVVLLAAFGWQLYSLQEKLEAAREEKERYAAQVMERQMENEVLAAAIAAGPTSEKIEEIARNELGYVKPDEYIFELGN